jgi:hypothetical protein
MSTLFSGQSLQPGQSLRSDNQWFTLIMQSDGNVVLYNSESKPLWWTNTVGTAAREFIMQTDGNLVLYGGGGNTREPHHAYWASKTQGNPGAFLNVQNDGNLVVYRAGSATETAGNALWDAGVPPPLNLKTVVEGGATLNVGDADLPNLSRNMLYGQDAPADAGGRLASYTEQGFWGQPGLGSCGHAVTVNADIDAYWNSGLGWTSSQLQDALAGALGAVMQAMANKTAYQNYSYTQAFGGIDAPDICVDPQPIAGYYIPPKIQITAYDNGGGNIGQVTVTYSTGDQSGKSTCDIVSALGSFLGIFPPASELAAIVGAGTALYC